MRSNEPGPDGPTQTAVDHPIDQLVRRVRLIDADQAALRADDDWFDALANRVAGFTVPDPADGTTPSEGAGWLTRWRRRVPHSIAFGAIAVGAVGVGAGAAVSVTQFFQPDRLTVVCVLGVDADSEQVEKRATVADPLAACRREWPTAAEVPELAVFMAEMGTVFVAPASWDGGGYDATRVAQDVAFDPRPARLQAALDDRIDGLQSDCFSQEEAVTRVQDDLERLGLPGWSVRTDDNGGRERPADGIQTCASAFIPEDDGPLREVVVRGVDGAQAAEPRRAAMGEAELRTYYTEEYRAAVKSGLEFETTEQQWVEESIVNTREVRVELGAMRATFATGRCLTADEAEQEITGLLDPYWNPVIDVSVDENLPCAIVDVGMGGTWLVSIVGPNAVTANDP